MDFRFSGDKRTYLQLRKSVAILRRSSIVFAVVHKAVFHSDNVVSSASRLGAYLRRREFIGLLGSAATAWPLIARAQQSTMPLIGLLFSGTREAFVNDSAEFDKGLKKVGYVDGQNARLRGTCSAILRPVLTDLTRSAERSFTKKP